jgi:hypothetical protein
MTAPFPHTLRASSRAGSAPAVVLPAAGAPYLGGATDLSALTPREAMNGHCARRESHHPDAAAWKADTLERTDGKNPHRMTQPPLGTVGKTEGARLKNAKPSRSSARPVSDLPPLGGASSSVQLDLRTRSHRLEMAMHHPDAASGAGSQPARSPACDARPSTSPSWATSLYRQLPRRLALAGAFCAAAGAAHAGTVAGWGNDLDPCLDIAAPADPEGRAQWAEWWLGLGCLIPANAGEWAPKGVTRPKPRPPCADVWRPGCPGRYAPGPWRWAGVSPPSSTPRGVAQAADAGSSYFIDGSGCFCGFCAGNRSCPHARHQPPASPPPQPPAIPLPASGLLLLAALAALWRLRA